MVTTCVSVFKFNILIDMRTFLRIFIYIYTYFFNVFIKTLTHCNHSFYHVTFQKYITSYCNVREKESDCKRKEIMQ